MFSNPELIQATLARANRADEELAKKIVEPLLRFGDVRLVDGKWVFQESYANISLVTEGTVVTHYYGHSKVEKLEPDIIETEGYAIDE